MSKKCIVVGTGVWGEWWCRDFLPPNVADGNIEVVAAVDRNPAALKIAQKHLGLNDQQCYTDAAEAFASVKANFCVNTVPPAFHEQIVDLAVAHGLHVLSEKPIADTLEAAVRIERKVREAGLKMAVTMSHRFDQDKTSLREQLRSGRWGGLDYLNARLSCNCRVYGSWGADYRHEMDDPLIVEGSIHHLDLLADLAGAKCEEIYAESWTPAWTEYKGDSNTLITMKFENGVRAVYEAALGNAIELNGWSREYIKAECEQGTLILDSRDLEVFPYDPDQTWHSGRAGKGEKIELLNQPKWANTWLIEKFVKYISGEEEMETNVSDNLQSVAMIFAAIRSSREKRVVKVQELLREHLIFD
jgi:predicted dehydrogenase